MCTASQGQCHFRDNNIPTGVLKYVLICANATTLPTPPAAKYVTRKDISLPSAVIT